MSEPFRKDPPDPSGEGSGGPGPSDTGSKAEPTPKQTPEEPKSAPASGEPPPLRDMETAGTQAPGTGSDSSRQETDQDVVNQVKVSIDQMTGNIQFGAEVMREALDIAEGGLRATGSRLSAKRFHRWSPERLRSTWEKLIFGFAQVESLVVAIERQRILVLIGDLESGKTSMACLVAARLVARFQLEEALYYLDSDDRIKLELDRLTGGDPAFARRVVMIELKSSISGDNLRIVSDLASGRVISNQSGLETADTYLLFVAKCLPIAEEKLVHDSPVHTMPLPDVGLLLVGLRQITSELTRSSGGDWPPSATKVDALIEQDGLRIVGRLRTFPRLERFLRQYLRKVLDGSLPIDEALEQAENLASWFLHDLPSEPASWYATLALTLCSAGPASYRVPWLQFEHLRSALEKLVDRSLHRRACERKLGDLTEEEAVLRGARVDIARTSFPEPYQVRFVGEGYVDRLWSALFDHGRRTLAVLIPILTQLAEGNDPYLQASAARALGRIGLMDFSYVTDSLLRRWSRKDQSHLLGHLILGTFGLKDSSYRQVCLGAVESLLLESTTGVVQTALRSLRQIASGDLDFSLAKMRALAQARLAIAWPEVGELTRSIHGLGVKLRAKAPPREVAKRAQAMREQVERSMVGLLWQDKETLRIFATFQATFNYLVATIQDERRLLEGLTAWARSDRDQLAPLVAFLFFNRDGAATYLQKADALLDDEETCSRLLLAAHRQSETGEALAALLVEVFLGLRQFPGILHHLLRERVIGLLANWSKQAHSAHWLRETIVRLFGSLYSAQDREIADFLLELTRDPSPPEERTDLRELVIEAIVGAGSFESAGPRL